MKAPTMTDVARHAGVSHATVSRIINGRPGVSSRAEAAVRKAIAELQYLAPPSENRPGRSAKPRESSLSRHVALLTFNSALTDHSSFVASIYEGARRAAREHDFAVSLLSMDDFDTVPDWIHPDNLDGLLLHGLRSRGHLTRTAAEIPSLWLTTHEAEAGGDSVLPGNDAVGEMAAAYLHDRNHQHIAALSIESNNPSYSVRTRAFTRSARKMGMQAMSFALTKREMELPGPAEKTSRLIDKLAVMLKEDRPTGLFFPSDYMAALAHAACRRIGLIPGKDFDFVSCDNESAYLDGLYPRPATIDLGTEARGKLAFEMLLSRIQDPARDRKATLLLDPVLVPSPD